MTQVLTENVGLVVYAALMVLYMCPVFGVHRAARRMPLDNLWYGLLCDRGHRNESSFESSWGRVTWQYHLAVLGCFALATTAVYDVDGEDDNTYAAEVHRHVWLHLAVAATVIGACMKAHVALEHRSFGKTSGDWVAAVSIVLFLRAAAEEVVLSHSSSRAQGSLHIILAAYCISLAAMCCRYSAFSLSWCDRDPTGNVDIPLPVAQPMSGKGSLAREAIAAQRQKRKAATAI